MPLANIKYLIFSVVALLSASQSIYAQTIFRPIGAYQWALGGSSVTAVDAWSATNNVGTMSELKKLQAGLSIDQRFLESSIRLSNLSMVMPTKYFHVGTSLNYFGYELFNQQKWSIGVSKKLSNMLSLGVQYNYVVTQIQGYGTRGKMALSAGMLVKPLPKLSLGFTIFNPTMNTLNDMEVELIPAYAKLGLAYSVSEKVLLVSELDQSLNNEPIFRGGVHYKIYPNFHLGIGACNNPVYYTFGTNFLFKSLKVDIATSIHQVLGVTPHLAISLPIGQ